MMEEEQNSDKDPFESIESEFLRILDESQKPMEQKREYVSVFKVNGRPILPPLMTPEKFKECRKWKEEAIRVEERIAERKKDKILASIRSYKVNGTPVLDRWNPDSRPETPDQSGHSEGSARKAFQELFSKLDAEASKPIPMMYGSLQSVQSVSTVIENPQYSHEKYADSDISTSEEEFDEVDERPASCAKSYTLEKPSPLLVAFAKKFGNDLSIGEPVDMTTKATPMMASSSIPLPMPGELKANKKEHLQNYLKMLQEPKEKLTLVDTKRSPSKLFSPRPQSPPSEASTAYPFSRSTTVHRSPPPLQRTPPTKIPVLSPTAGRQPLVMRSPVAARKPPPISPVAARNPPPLSPVAAKKPTPPPLPTRSPPVQPPPSKPFIGNQTSEAGSRLSTAMATEDDVLSSLPYESSSVADTVTTLKESEGASTVQPSDEPSTMRPESSNLEQHFRGDSQVTLTPPLPQGSDVLEAVSSLAQWQKTELERLLEAQNRQRQELQRQFEEQQKRLTEKILAQSQAAPVAVPLPQPPQPVQPPQPSQQPQSRISVDERDDPPSVSTALSITITETEPRNGPQPVAPISPVVPAIRNRSTPVIQPSPVEFRLPEEALTPRMHKSFCKMTALARGFLTRRLLKTEKVQSLIRTMRDSMYCALELQREAKSNRGVKSEDISLHRQFLQQLTKASHDLHNIFFCLGTAERMSILYMDREARRNRATRGSEPARRVSSATAARIQHKQQLDVMQQQQGRFSPERRKMVGNNRPASRERTKERVAPRMTSMTRGARPVGVRPLGVRPLGVRPLGAKRNLSQSLAAVAPSNRPAPKFSTTSRNGTGWPPSRPVTKVAKGSPHKITPWK